MWSSYVYNIFQTFEDMKTLITCNLVPSSLKTVNESLITVNKLYEFSAPKKLSESIISQADIQFVMKSLKIMFKTVCNREKKNFVQS